VPEALNGAGPVHLGGLELALLDGLEAGEQQ
jgi:hypothetical protein